MSRTQHERFSVLEMICRLIITEHDAGVGVSRELIEDLRATLRGCPPELYREVHAAEARRSLVSPGALREAGL